MDKFTGLIGVLVILGTAYLFSEDRKAINFKLVGWGLLLQIIFALIVLKTSIGREFFEWTNDLIVGLLDFTKEGSRFVFGSLLDVQKSGFIFAVQVLPTIIFFSSFMAVMYHLGIMQAIVYVIAKIMAKTMGTSGAESLSAAANIFVGQTEAPLVIRPYVPTMTRSELLAIMVGGMATVAGGVMAAYVGMLRQYFPGIAGHLLAASIMNAPAGLVMAKMLLPEKEEPLTKGVVKLEIEQADSNVIDAAARGASDGMQLAINVAAMLLAFIALLALINSGLVKIGNAVDKYLLGKDPYKLIVVDKVDLSNLKGKTINLGGNNLKVLKADNNFLIVDKPLYGKKQYQIDLNNSKITFITTGAYKFSMENILGTVLSPVAWVMGVPWKDAKQIGALLGEKTVINEFIAYSHLGQLLQTDHHLSKKSVIIATYALCGFANFSSIAIQLGGIGGLAPNRRSELAQLGFRALLGGTLATFLTASIAGVLTSL